jgi:CheY-like chemotaxis protein
MVMAKKRHILIMEDEDLILEQWAMILEDEGFRVTPAPNAKESIDLIEAFIKGSEKVDCFLLDIIIVPWEPFTEKETDCGFITGLKVADYIIHNYIKISDDYKIIFVTAALGVPGAVSKKVNEYVKRRSDKCDLVTKPIDFELLMEKINA